MATSQNGNGRPAVGRAKRVIVADRVRFGLDVLSDTDREAVLGAIDSWQSFRPLTRTARTTGGTGSRLRLAHVTPTIDVMYRETSGRVEVLDLVNVRSLDLLGVETVPAATERPAKTRA